MGLVGQLYRLELDGPDGTSTVIAKMAAPTDEGRFVATVLNMYGREVGFYEQLSPRTTIAHPECFHAAHDPATQDAVLLLEDVSPRGRLLDQIAGCSVGDARPAIRALAALHACFWDDATLDDVPTGCSGSATTRIRARSRSRTRRRGRACRSSFRSVIDARGPRIRRPLRRADPRTVREALGAAARARARRLAPRQSLLRARRRGDRGRLAAHRPLGRAARPRVPRDRERQRAPTGPATRSASPTYLGDLAAHGVNPDEAWAFEMYRYGAMLGFVYPVIAAGALTIDDPRHIELTRAMLVRSLERARGARRVRAERSSYASPSSFSMFSSVFSIDSRVCWWTLPARRNDLRHLLLRDVPASRAPACRRRRARARSARSRPAGDLAHEARRARLPRDAPVVLELDDRAHHRVGDAELHRHPERVAELHALRAVLRLAAPSRSRRCRDGGSDRRAGRRSLRVARGSHARRTRCRGCRSWRGSVRCNGSSMFEGARHAQIPEPERPRGRKLAIAITRGSRSIAAACGSSSKASAGTGPTVDDCDRGRRLRRSSPRRRGCRPSTRCRSPSRRTTGTLIKSEKVAVAGLHGTVYRVMYVSQTVQNKPVAGHRDHRGAEERGAAEWVPGRVVGPRHERHGRHAARRRSTRPTTCRSRTCCSTRVGRSRRATTRVRERPGLLPYIAGDERGAQHDRHRARRRATSPPRTRATTTSCGVTPKAGRPRCSRSHIGPTLRARAASCRASSPVHRRRSSTLIYTFLKTSPFRYYLLMAAGGLNAAYGDTVAPLDQVLTPAGMKLIPLLDKGCSGYVSRHAREPRHPTLTKGDPFKVPAWKQGARG